MDVFVVSCGTADELDAEIDDPVFRHGSLEDFAAPQLLGIFATQEKAVEAGKASINAAMAEVDAYEQDQAEEVWKPPVREWVFGLHSTIGPDAVGRETWVWALEENGSEVVAVVVVQRTEVE